MRMILLLLLSLVLTSCISAKPDSLAVEFLDFKIEKAEVGIDLFFTTAGENYPDYFVVEVKKGEDWIELPETKLQPIKEKEASYQTSYYKVRSGRSFFRIKQVDIDGELSYSVTKSVVIESAITKVYPNPTAGEFNVYPVPIAVELYNYLGQRVKVQTTGEGIYDATGLPPGLYQVKVLAEDTADYLFKLKLIAGGS